MDSRSFDRPTRNVGNPVVVQPIDPSLLSDTQGILMQRLSGLICASLGFFAFVLAGPAGAADEHVAIFKNVSGSIAVLRNDATLDAASGMELLVSDRLASGPGASAGVAFRDGTLLTVGPSTQIEIRDYVFEPKQAKYAFSVYLAKGSAIYSSGKIGKLAPEAVKVDSPMATVGVRGTRFIIEAQ